MALLQQEQLPSGHANRAVPSLHGLGLFAQADVDRLRSRLRGQLRRAQEEQNQETSHDAAIISEQPKLRDGFGCGRMAATAQSLGKSVM